MIDRPRSKSILDPRASSLCLRMHNLPALSGWLCQSVDMIILCVAFVSVAILPLYRKDAGLMALVQGQISLRDAVVAVVCLATWRMILMSIGMYLPARTLPEYILRCFIGLNCCTGVIGLIELVLRPGVDVWHFAAIYWLIGGALMVLLRLALFFIRPRRRGLSPVNQR